MIKVDAHFPSVYTYLYYTLLAPPRVYILTTRASALLDN